GYREVASALHGMRLVHVAYLDLLPLEHRWTVAIPSSMVGVASAINLNLGTWNPEATLTYVANAPVTRGVLDMLDTPDAVQRWPRLAGAPTNVADVDADIYEATAESTYVMRYGHMGVPWPGRGLPSEADADMNAYAPMLTEAI